MAAVALALLLEQVVAVQCVLFGLVLQVLPEPSHQQIQVTCKEISWQ
jgi:hypothetical protein